MKYYLKDKKRWHNWLKTLGEYHTYQDVCLPRKKIFNIIINEDVCKLDYKWTILARNKKDKEDNFPITQEELDKFFMSEKEYKAIKFNNKLEKELK